MKNEESQLSINELQDEIIDEFSVFDDWMDKYNYLIELSRELPLMEASYKTDTYLIDGCQSRVWIHATIRDNLLFLTADSDAIISKGLIALLVRVFNGRTPEEIYQSELYFIDRIGMKENLTPTRANGLLSMIKQIKMYALAFMNTKKN